MNKRPRAMQLILNDVIAGGYYAATEGGYTQRAKHSKFMCCAIQRAAYAGDVTAAEYRYAEGRIEAYLATASSEHITLEVVLKEQGLPWDYEARLRIFKNWAKRPKLNRQAGA